MAWSPNCAAPRRLVTTFNCNWKLVVDSFAEIYHIPVLHPKTAAPTVCGKFNPMGRLLDVEFKGNHRTNSHWSDVVEVTNPVQILAYQNAAGQNHLGGENDFEFPPGLNAKRAKNWTVDLNIAAKNDRLIRAGFGVPPRLSLGAKLEALRHPGWMLEYLRGGMASLDQWAQYAPAGADPLEVHRFYLSQRNSCQSWRELELLRKLWKGPLIVKGILHADDAVRAAELGADGVVVGSALVNAIAKSLNLQGKPTGKTVSDVLDLVKSLAQALRRA